jgi:MoaA/NifB/PqqE/SkfB family radical SAM enzyme
MSSLPIRREWWAAPVEHVQGARRAIGGIGADGSVVSAVLRHLAAPSVPAASLAAATGVPMDTVLQAYRLCRDHPTVRAFTASGYYPHRLWTHAAAALTARWQADPTVPARLLDEQPVPPDTVEIHPSRGTCAYGCAMCLWSDKDTLTYVTKNLRADGLLALRQWTELLDQLRRLGTTQLVVSGGGEALLNPDLPAVLRHAGGLGFATSLYTTGFNLDAHRGALWEPVAGLSAVRLSIHSPDPATYARVVRLPERVHALDRVTEHLRQLLSLRAGRGAGPRIGIGFVLQPGNHDQIEAMADYAARIGVDHLDLRKDEVDVTAGLTATELAEAAVQLRRVRHRAAGGGYGRLDVDLGDELIALANGQPASRPRSSECRVKYLRPTISPYGVLAHPVT